MADALFDSPAPPEQRCRACGKAAGHLLTCRLNRAQGPGTTPVKPSQTRHRSSDPDTSREAAEGLRNIRATHRFVLETLARMPRTDEQIADQARADEVRVSPSGLRTRRSELVEAGYVRATDIRLPLASGRLGIVWALTPEGLAAHLESSRLAQGGGQVGKASQSPGPTPQAQEGT